MEYSLGLSVAAVSIYLVRAWATSSHLPESLHWVGLRNEFFAKFRACIREYTAGLRNLADGYLNVSVFCSSFTFMSAYFGLMQYSRNGQPFVIPDAGMWPHVILPQEHLSWVMEQPNDVLSSRAVIDKRMAFKYLIPTFDIHEDLFLTDVIRRDLTRNLGKTQAALFDEMRQSVDATFGQDQATWREVGLLPVMRTILFRSSNRVLLGPHLCRNEEYQKSSESFSTWLGASALLIGQLVPWFISPVLGYLTAIPVYIYRNKAFKHLIPLIKERMDNIKRKILDPQLVYEEPNDLVTWYVNAVLGSEITNQSTPQALANRILFLVSLHYVSV